MKRFVVPLAVALCFLSVVSQQSTVSAKDTWISIRTKNFYVIGNANENDLRKAALKLEQFREAFTQLLPGMKFNTPVPTTVVAFKNKSSYEPFGPPNTSGYFQAGADVNYIALSTDWYRRGDDGLFEIIFHEFTHLLVDNTLKNSPLWFNEGLAEYYSTFKISRSEYSRAITSSSCEERRCCRCARCLRSITSRRTTTKDRRRVFFTRSRGR
jgi:type I restriction-modification system DNA methylase subunit